MAIDIEAAHAFAGERVEELRRVADEGVCSALRGAELLAGTLAVALESGAPVLARRLAPYVAARRRAFLGKWWVERLIAGAMAFPRFFDRAVSRLSRRGLAHTLVGVTGEFVPPGAVLDPRFLARAVL